MPTSGTTSETVFRTQMVYDHAFRRAGITPEQITDQLLETAQETLYTKLSALPNQVIPLWCIESIILPLYEGQQTVVVPRGVVDVLNANLRTFTRLTTNTNVDPLNEGTSFGIATSSQGVANNAFDGDITTECVQTNPNGWIQLAFSAATRVTMYGILPGATGDWSFEIQGWNGTQWITLTTYVEQEMIDGEWLWFDLEGSLTYQIFRLQATDGTILDVREIVFGSTPMEVPIALINRDDYYNLPDKTFLGRPTEYWLDKQRERLRMLLWPSPQYQFTFGNLRVQVQKYIQDVGSMTEYLDIPQRWFEWACWSLAEDMCFEAKEADRDRINYLQGKAREAYANATAGESDRAPTSLVPRIRPYTR